MNTHEACEVEEYINGEDSLSVCNDLENENWDDSFFAQLNQEEPEEEDNDECEQQALVGTQQNIKSYRDANKYLEEVQEFLEQQGHVEDAFKIGSIIDNISFFEVSRSKQTTLDSWLN